jgi:hypothetical protein
VATIKRDAEDLLLSGGVEYRDAELNTSRARATGWMEHAMHKIQNRHASIERLGTTGPYVIDRYLTGARYEYVSKENLTLAFDYRWTNVYSPDVYAVNYYNNRYTVELRKSF